MRIIFGLLLLMTFVRSLYAQSYSIDWHTIDGGGGTSTNAQFALSGTVGQPDASGSMTNGQYAVVGGFWVLPKAVQTEGAPALTIAPAGPGYATISWTPSATSFVLEETLSLSSASWTNSPSGSTNPVTLSTTDAAKFFRLRKQP